MSDYISAANDEVTLLIQVETRQCYEDLEVGRPEVESASGWLRG